MENREKLNDRDKIDALKYLSSIHRSQADERRKYEWKIIFAVLAFYVSSIVATFNKSIYYSDYKFVIWIVFIFSAITCSFYLLKIHYANRQNNKFAEEAEKIIERIVKGDLDIKINIFHSINNGKIFDCSKKYKEILIEYEKFIRSYHSINWIAQIIIVWIFAISSAYVLVLDKKYNSICKRDEIAICINECVKSKLSISKEKLSDKKDFESVDN